MKGPLQSYRRLISDGELAPDPMQALAAEQLQLLANRLATFATTPKFEIFNLFSLKTTPAPKGLYLFGGVGRGKTMLMDLFFETIDFTPKRRVHFHEFMAEIHAAIATARKSVAGDPIAPVAEAISAKARLLCFDELQVNDITDAMILGRLFTALFAQNVVMVTTSNQAPGGLYENGLNRALFVPFIELLEEKLEVIHLEAARDYRLDKLADAEVYLAPLGAETDARLENLWRRMTHGLAISPGHLEVMGRRIDIPLSAAHIARFTFEDLCGQPLGAADYLTLARRFHTVFVTGIPALGPANRNEARRFINLIDALYDNGVCLIATAQAEPARLYVQGDGAEAFQRTASRLIEMRSHDYLTGTARGLGG